jgi:hypothetical protein
MTNNKAITLTLLLTLIALPSWAWVAGAGSEKLVSEKDFNDKDSIYLAGYGLFSQRKASTIHDNVYARSLYLSDGNTKLLMTSLDVVGFSQKLTESLRTKLSTALDIPSENIILSATHTHSSIDLQGLWGNIEDDQRKQIEERVLSSARQAKLQAKPATLSMALSDQGKGYNRRLKSAHIIPQILSLKITGKQGSPIALLFSFGSHPVVLDSPNKQISSDWVSYTRLAIEREFKAPAMFINGSVGDVLPSRDGSPNDDRTFQYAEAYGFDIANAILNSLKHSPETLNSQLSYCTETIEVDVDNLTLIGLTKGLNNGIINWPSLSSTTVTTRTSLLILDKLILMTVPGEPVTQLSEQLMSKVSDRPVAVLSLTHDSLGYVIPEKDHGRENGYEESMALSNTYGTQISQSMDRLLKECLLE